MKLPKERLWVSVYKDDEEAYAIWLNEIKMPTDRIVKLGDKSNFWPSNARLNGPNGPCGPCSEIFYDYGVNPKCPNGAKCDPDCSCGRFSEVWNLVFTQFNRKDGGALEPLPAKNIDTGMGLERLAAVVQGKKSNYETDNFAAILGVIKDTFKANNAQLTESEFRIIADHMRAATFMIADGVRPSNTERGYILRRLIRRAAQHAQKLGVEHDQKEESMLSRCAVLVIEKYKDAYPELDGDTVYREITETIWNEEKQFAHALEAGMKEFERLILDDGDRISIITGEQAYMLFTTYGFPFEMTAELAAERTLDVDEVGFRELMKRHQDLSRAGSEQKFKGGLTDTSEKTTRLHTAHHLLLKALQIVLGPHVKQRGSNITQERLRIDFNWDSKMMPEQIGKVEAIVNEKIKEELPVIRSTLRKEEAEKLGAQQEFGTKYPDTVSVYSIGPKDGTINDPRFSEAFSIEFCGGPHVSNTREIGESGNFRIQKEEAVAAGVRRIRGVLTN